MRFPPAKPPPNQNVLAKWIDHYAAQEAIAPDRVRRAIAFECCIAAFSRHDPPHSPRILIKGGAAMELRLQSAARATKDIDAVLRDAAPDAIEASVDAALAAPLLDGLISFRTVGQEPIGTTGALRFDVRVLYRGQSFAKIRLEVSSADPDENTWDSVDPLNIAPTLGIDVGLKTVPCLSIQDQIAQKLHAVTDPYEGNDRYRDLIDVILLDDLKAVPDALVLQSCIRVFDQRAGHSWPPVVTVRPGWPEGYTRLAGEMGLEPSDMQAAAHTVQGIIDRISGPSPEALG